jgi:ribosomal protein S6--L-glutamate ligase
MRKIGLWIHENDNGVMITQKLTKLLQAMELEVVVLPDLGKCICKNGQVLGPQGENLSNLNLLYHMNIEGETPHQQDILKALEVLGVMVVNSTHAYRLGGDKFLANMILRKNGITVPDSMLMTSAISYGPLAETFKEWNQIVLKPRFSYGGKGILKFSEVDQFWDFMTATSNIYYNYYIERFIPFQNNDYRIEVIDGNFAGSYSRGLLNGFKTNMTSHKKSEDGIFLKYEASESEKAIAIKAVQLLGLDCSIVDLIRSSIDGKFYILEVNCILGIFVEAANKVRGIVPAEPDAYKFASDDRKLELLSKFLHKKLLLREKI